MRQSMNIQIFGIKNSPATRAAERFFKERRVEFHFVDLKQRPMAAGEIKRFVDRFGLAELIDTEGKQYVDAGLKYLKLTDAEVLTKVERQPGLLRLPLVRCANQLSIGQDKDAWIEMLRQGI
jgi:arsenate reductase-like glutaredoxin family protein